jgi:hypothetical protein
MKRIRFLCFLMASSLVMAGAATYAQNASASATTAPPDRLRVVLPIRQTVLKDGVIRYSVPVTIDGVGPIDTMLDTGSKGLRVLSSALVHQHEGAPATYSYGSGVKVTGQMAPLALGLGDVHGNAQVQIITGVGCVEKHPRCPASRIDYASFRLGGEGVVEQGFEALLGISVTAAGRQADNPLSALGVDAWIVELPRPGDSAPGKLILNPTADEQRAYAHFPVNERGQIDGCLKNRTSNEQICKPILLDTGETGVIAAIPDVSRPQPWAEGTPALLSFAAGAADTPLTFEFNSQAPRAPGFVVVVPQGDAPFPHIFAGALPYFSFSVLYRRDESWIGLAKRAD